jgi:hypothetical protein
MRPGPEQGTAEIQAVTPERAAEAGSRFPAAPDPAEWSRGPGPAGHRRLGDSADGLIISGRGQARFQAGAAITMPGRPTALAACTQAGMACLVTETGQLALWQLADDAC